MPMLRQGLAPLCSQWKAVPQQVAKMVCYVVYFRSFL